MNPSKSKFIASVVGCILLFLAVTYLAGAFCPQNKPVESAMAECRAKGWQEQDLGITTLQLANYGLLSTASITLNSKDRNQPKAVHVQLRNWLNLLGWEVVDYKEE